jgi:hypothetical protein
VRRYQGRLSAVATVLIVGLGLSFLPNVASARTTLANSRFIDTHRVIGPLIETGAEFGSPHLFGPRVAKAKTAKPSVQKQPSSLSVKSGAHVSFIASANGSPTPTVQWKDSPDGKTWTPIKGATKATYAFVASARQEGYHYEAIFKNAAGSTTSHVVKLTVISAPLVTLQPTAAAVEVGQPVSFSADAAASPKPSVRWEMSAGGASWTAIPGATSDVYSFTAALGQSGEEFEAIFKNSHGQTRTHVAALTVTPAPIAPAITTQPTSTSGNAGATVSFVAAASGSPAPSVQWEYSVNGSPWASIPGATSTTYSFAVPAAAGGTQFEAVFTNVAGSATSSPAVLTVNVTPTVTTQPVGQVVAAGTSVSFSSTATGSPAPSVQWEYSADNGATWQVWPGNTATTLSFVAASNQSLFQFEAVFSNPAGTATSTPALLTITQGPNFFDSSNWSGYADYDPTGSTTFSAASSSWTVPAVTCNGSSSSYSSEWVGIDGFLQSPTVEQDGTEMDCKSGVASYDAWVEMYGDDDDPSANYGYEIELPDPVEPGDVITASVSVANNLWTLSLSDASSAHGWSTSRQFTFAAQEASAEWVLERPEVSSMGGFPALADFGASNFTNAQVTSTQGIGSIDDFDNDQIFMLGNTNNVLAAPGSLNAAGTSFTDTWSGPS